MTLAEGRPLRRRMMAAMAQQDCGQCGYNCEDYSNLIVAKKEERLNLCVPGGKETARMLKSLYEELGKAPRRRRRAAPASAALRRAAPCAAPLARQSARRRRSSSRTRLNKPGSEKETWHIEFDLAGSGIDYAVGDSFGLFPTNDPALADAVIRALDAPPDFPIGGRTLREVLTDGVSLSPAPDTLFQLYLVSHRRRAAAEGEGARGGRRSRTATRRRSTCSPRSRNSPASGPIRKPSSRRSSRCSRGSIRSRRRRRPIPAASRSPSTPCATRSASAPRLGVASTFLAERVAPGAPLKVYVQKAHAFGLPADPAAPIIMIGPGTGIAPFRAFLHERMATKANGRNWLFFGHQRSACDFFYEDELAGMKAKGVLTRLSLAWSRDGAEKFYVQDRMREVGRDLWPGSPTARISMSAATPSAWRRMSSARWSTSWRSTARARPTRRSPSWRT